MSCKVFSLFNAVRWNEFNTPKCVSVVPILYTGQFCTSVIDAVLGDLAKSSVVSPGYTNPEGIIIYHTKVNVSFKKTFDDNHKG